MIFGRSPNLLVGALTAVFNVLVAFRIIEADASQIAVVNLAFGSVVAFVANNNAIQIRAGRNARNRVATTSDTVPKD